MNNDRAVVNFLCRFESFHKVGDVVAIDVADVLKTKFIDQGSGQYGCSDRIFYGFRGTTQRSTNAWHALECIAYLFFPMLIALSLFDAVKIATQAADSRSDRHAVVVEQNDERRLQMACLVDGFHCHTAGE